MLIEIMVLRNAKETIRELLTSSPPAITVDGNTYSYTDLRATYAAANMDDIPIDDATTAHGKSMADFASDLANMNGTNGPVMADTPENRRNYLRKTQHLQELFIMLSGGITRNGNKYGIGIRGASDYRANDSSVARGNTTLASKLTNISATDEDEETITSAFQGNLNLDETINALQSTFDSQLTQRKDSTEADRRATQHFLTQAEIQSGSGNFKDDLAQLFFQRKN